MIAAAIVLDVGLTAMVAWAAGVPLTTIGSRAKAAWTKVARRWPAGGGPVDEPRGCLGC